MKRTRRGFLKCGASLASAMAITPWIESNAHAAQREPAAGRVKIGVVGVAHSHAAGKTAALRRLNELFEVVGIVEADEKRVAVASASAEYRGLPFLSEEQLLNVPGLQAVLIETAVKDLTPTATRFAIAGLHLHVEKPGGPSLPAFSKLLDIVKQKGRFLQMGYMFRRNPAFEFCFQAARDGWLGQIYEIDASMGKVATPGERADMAQFPGGTMFELGCHLIDAMVTLLGRPRAVHSFLRTTHPQRDALADNCLALCEFENAVATIGSNANDVEAGHSRTFVVRGDAATVRILPLEPPKLSLTLSEPRGEYVRGTQSIPLRKMPGRFDDQLADFAGIILGQKQPDYLPEHDLMVLETVLKASGMGTD